MRIPSVEELKGSKKIMALSPDMVLYNGKMATMKSKSDIVEAIAIKGDRIIATGNDQEMRGLSHKQTVELDLGGRLVLPGLTDSHTHIENIAEGMFSINLKGAQSINQVLKTIEENVPHEPDKWVVSSWWHPFAQLREKRLPTRFEIDKVCPNNPVLLTTVGHIAIANSRALELAGIDKSSPDPDGGRIERDAVTGDIDGVLKETAIGLVQKLIPPYGEIELEEKYNEVMAAHNRVGITSIFTGATAPRALGIWKSLHSKRRMSVRVALAVIPTNEETPRGSDEGFGSALDGLDTAVPVDDRFLSLGCIKFVLDGGMTLKTAALSESYPDDPGNCGMLTMDQERLNALVCLCNRRGFRVGIHAVGDRAIDTVLNSYEEANKEKGILGKRFILIHGFLIRPDQIHRASKLNIILATQNVFMYEKAEVAARFLGEARSNVAIPTNSMIEGGLVVTGGSDADVNSFNPFLGIYQAVTRKSKEGKIFGPDEKIGRWEALCMYTKWAALQSFEEEFKGVLAPGKLADLIVTSTDITACPEEEIKETQVLMTMVGGKIVHSTNELL
jgi:predicted amidohydrolase YtcJ